MLVSLKQQFVELLSDIGFVKEGITYRDVERAARYGTDGVIELTGQEVQYTCYTPANKVSCSRDFEDIFHED